MQTIYTENHPIYIGNDSLAELNDFLTEGKYSFVYILVDTHTKTHCLPAIKKKVRFLRPATVISIQSGEKNKNIRTCEKIWNALSMQNAGRKSLLVNLGGGVITDTGGFAAATYKRGIDFIHLPTTLLAQVDASMGGKTGVDFNNYKNQVGAFAFPKAVFIHPAFLKTLPERELLSGFAEMIKHGLIADKNYWDILCKVNRNKILSPHISSLIYTSVQIKNNIVSQDPYEKGLRKTLNFGHTIGHAAESASLKLKKKLLHGEAIAIGMICEAYLSRKCKGLSSGELISIIQFIGSLYRLAPLSFPAKKLIDLMKQDKKNEGSEINFTLLDSIGHAGINNFCSEELIEEAIYFFNSLCK